MNAVPLWLKKFFILHFIIDIISASILFIFPEILDYLGWKSIDPIATRAAASALFAIGIESFLCQKDSILVFYSMLRLKIIWSFFAIIAAIIGIISFKENIPIGLSIMFVVFLIFHFLWLYWFFKVRKILLNGTH